MKKYKHDTKKLKAKNLKREEKLEQRRNEWRQLYQQTKSADKYN